MGWRRRLLLGVDRCRLDHRRITITTTTPSPRCVSCVLAGAVNSPPSFEAQRGRTAITAFMARLMIFLEREH